MERFNRATDGSGSGSDPPHELEEALWKLGLDGEESYPERSEEPDCIYFLRTGFCGYGSRCRFNHPRTRRGMHNDQIVGAARPGGGEPPERTGQPICQYYTRMGTCKFGASCKYYHPRQGGDSVSHVSLNYYGYPLRLGEKDCSYYLKSGRCKFGEMCKFNHPQPIGMQLPVQSPALQASSISASTIYHPVQSPSASPMQHYGAVVARPPILPSSYLHSAYGPLLLSPGMIPFPGWSPYQASVSPGASPSTQPSVGSGPFYGITQLNPSAPVYTGSYSRQSRSLLSLSSGPQVEHSFPQRPGQPDCQYFLRRGDCKFGSSCKYHHPAELIAPKGNVMLSPLGFPLRPGAPVCNHFAQHGVCKYGLACKFDHPSGTLSYSPSASSLADMPVAPYPVGSSIGTLAPSSSSSELRQEHALGSSKDSNFTVISSAMSTSTISVGSITSTSGSISHSGVDNQSLQSTGQLIRTIATPSSSTEASI